MAIAVGEKKIKFAKTDASLYNGLPFDMGSMYHSVGGTTSTLSIQEERDEVSVGNVHTPRSASNTKYSI